MPAEHALTRERVIRPRHGLVAVNFAELWRYRELFGFLAWRDILVRYKQTVFGVAWALARPLTTTAVFAFGAAGGHVYQVLVNNNYAANNSSLLLVMMFCLPWS